MQGNRKNKVTLPTLSKKPAGSGKWRTAMVLVSVPVQASITDKEVTQWVREAIDTFDLMTLSLANYCAPKKVGKLQVKQFHRYVRGVKQSKKCRTDSYARHELDE